MLDAVRLRSWGGEGKACEHPESPVPAVTGLLVSGGGGVVAHPVPAPQGRFPVIVALRWGSRYQLLVRHCVRSSEIAAVRDNQLVRWLTAWAWKAPSQAT